MSELLSSYSSANVFPAKILKHEKLFLSCLDSKHVFPIHVQLNVTNSCQLACEFCSCSGRDKSLQLSLSEIEEIMTKAQRLGCESVTCTGGGEFLLHKNINDIFWMLHILNVEVGLVTNGLLLNRIENESARGIVWCRISSSDDLPDQLQRIGKTVDEWLEIIDQACSTYPHVDWAFSHVLSEKPKPSLLYDIIDFANEHKFTHTRIVSDILHADKLYVKMNSLRGWFKRKGVDTSHVIFQPRSRSTHGQNPCYISLLKPVIGADGYLYPCCGTQYALENPSRDYELTMRMGKALELDSLVEKQRFFNGQNCVRCFYSNYNWALRTMLGNVKHAKFI